MGSSLTGRLWFRLAYGPKVEEEKGVDEDEEEEVMLLDKGSDTMKELGKEKKAKVKRVKLLKLTTTLILSCTIYKQRKNTGANSKRLKGLPAC